MPLVMYSHPNSPKPSTTAVAPEFRTASGRRPHLDEQASAGGTEEGEVADQDVSAGLGEPPGERTITVPPIGLPTLSLAVPEWDRVMPSLQKTP